MFSTMMGKRAASCALACLLGSSAAVSLSTGSAYAQVNTPGNYYDSVKNLPQCTHAYATVDSVASVDSQGQTQQRISSLRGVNAGDTIEYALTIHQKPVPRDSQEDFAAQVNLFVRPAVDGRLVGYHQSTAGQKPAVPSAENPLAFHWPSHVLNYVIPGQKVAVVHRHVVTPDNIAQGNVHKEFIFAELPGGSQYCSIPVSHDFGTSRGFLETVFRSILDAVRPFVTSIFHFFFPRSGQ